MPYVCRNADGIITSLHREHVPDASEFLDDRHPDIQAFVGNTSQRPEEFSRLDADFVRVIEDVIDTLIMKNVINITDLPAEAQAKLFARKTFRERISKNSLRLFEPTDFGDVI
jgi:hypothetical protein